MRNLCYSPINALDATVTQTSNKIDANQLFAISLIAAFTAGDAAGTVKFQGSNDPTNSSNLAADFTPSTWVDIPSASASVSTGTTKTISVNPVVYRWLRVVWTPSGGAAGTVTVSVNAQSV